MTHLEGPLINALQKKRIKRIGATVLKEMMREFSKT